MLTLMSLYLPNQVIGVPMYFRCDVDELWLLLAMLIRLFQYVMFDVCCVVWLDGVQFLFFAIFQRATNSVLFYESEIESVS